MKLAGATGLGVALPQKDAIRGIAEAASMSDIVADILHRSGKIARLRTKGIPS